MSRRGIARRHRRIHASPRREDLDLVMGRWKVVEVLYEPYVRHSDSDDEVGAGVSDHMDIAGQFKGVELILDDQSEVVWCLPRGVDPLPLFLTSSFAIDKDEIGFIGGPDGKMFTFEVEGDTDFLQLSSDCSDLDGTLTIRITRVKGNKDSHVDHFSLKDALEEGFFSDLVVKSSDGHKFPVHRAILASCCPGMQYRDWEMLLSKLGSTLVSAVLSYIYTDCLPPGLTVPLAKELLAAASTNPKLSHLTDLCKTFLDNHNIKQRLIQLVDDFQACLEVLRKIVESTEMSNPVKVAYAIKQMAKEAAVGATRFGMLCELYSRNKKEMSRADKQEALDYFRGRVVVFIDQIRELLDLVLSKWNTLTDDQKAEVAQHIIPEVESMWDLIVSTCKGIHSAMEDRKNSLVPQKTFGRLERRDLKLALALKFMTRSKELRRLEKIGKEFEDFMEVAERKREEFRDWSEDEKVARIVWAIRQLELEGQNQVEQLEETKKEILIDNVLEWKKFKFLVALACSYMSWGMSRVQLLREPLKPVLLKACKFVQRKELTEALVFLGMMEEVKEGVPTGGKTEVPCLPSTGGPDLSPPSLQDSKLALGCRQLLCSQEHSDLQFIVSGREGGEGGKGGEGGEDGKVVIHAHRVIVAARCQWFRRALLSGMKEAIDRRIVVHDVDETVFRTFLFFLYGGPLDLPSTQTEDLIELMAVADRYEAAELRGRCEEALVQRVASTNVLMLLAVADRYSARSLRETTLQHVLQTSDVNMTEMEGWARLPHDLQQELQMLVTATADPSHQHEPSLLHQHDSSFRHRHTNVSSALGRESEVNPNSDSSDSSTCGVGEMRGSPFNQEPSLHAADALAFDTALRELRGVVGDEVSEDLLRDLLLAADMDINRAVNYYFNTQGSR